MRIIILGREVEGDEHGLHHLEAIGHEAEALFDEAKVHHEAKFANHEGHHFILARASAGHYVVASDSRSW